MTLTDKKLLNEEIEEFVQYKLTEEEGELFRKSLQGKSLEEKRGLLEEAKKQIERATQPKRPFPTWPWYYPLRKGYACLHPKYSAFLFKPTVVDEDKFSYWGLEWWRKLMWAAEVILNPFQWRLKIRDE